MESKIRQPRTSDNLATDVLIARTVAEMSDVWVESDGEPRGTLPDGRRVILPRYSSTRYGMACMIALLERKKIPYLVKYEPERKETQGRHYATLRGETYTGGGKYACRALAKALVKLIREEIEPLPDEEAA